MAAVEKLNPKHKSKSFYEDMDHHHTAGKLESGVCETGCSLMCKKSCIGGVLQEQKLQLQVKALLKSWKMRVG